jgi:hypothetical protein
MAKKGSGGKVESVAWAHPASRSKGNRALTRPLAAFVGGSAPLARLQDRAALLSQIQRSLDLLLPDYMAGAVQVANCENHVLALHVSGAAVAARLKMLQPRLREGLWAQGHPIEEIRVRIRPPKTALRHHEIETRTLSGSTLDQLEKLRESLPERSPLAGPLAHLIAEAIRRD